MTTARAASASEAESTAGVRFPPPLLFLAGLAAGALLDRALPLDAPLAPMPWRVPLGAPFLVGGIALDIWALVTLRRARTTVLPWGRAEALVAEGPFRFSRNPIYVGYALSYVGVAFWTSGAWALVLLPLVLLATARLVVAREERHLAARFGDAYAAYRARVRRWL